MSDSVSLNRHGRSIEHQFIGGLLTDMKKKVQEMLDELNKGQAGVWVAAGGAHALTQVTKNDDKGFSFNPGSGIPIKVFYNQVTGEMRLFPAMMFDDAF